MWSGIWPAKPQVDKEVADSLKYGRSFNPVALPLIYELWLQSSQLEEEFYSTSKLKVEMKINLKMKEYFLHTNDQLNCEILFISLT